MLAALRNRHGLVTAVQADDGADGRLHLVTVEYLDAGGPAQEAVLWESEPFARCIEPEALPGIVERPPMPLDEYRALTRASRWSALEPYVDPDGDGPLDRSPLASPLHGAIQAEDYQLLPLWQAMRMPRVSLLLADDVGLGKTIEAGLIVSELIRRRRARRILVVCPASLRQQWVDELASKFSLEFDIVDRNRSHQLRRRFGMDANPWRSLSRIVTSYDYLKQADVFASFKAASQTEDQASLPWDLLIVDEAHNLAPAPIGRESEAARLLGQLTPLFEHRLFLTATPHNGHTSSFTGLLESLDPVRFSRKWEPLSHAEKNRVDQVLVRRLKREVNDRDQEAGRVPRFANRTPEAVELAFEPNERALLSAFTQFRSAIKKLVADRSKGDRHAGSFAVEILGKRLLSSPVTFAESWHRYLEGAKSDEETTADEIHAAERSIDEDLADDREAERRRTHAVSKVGAWLRPLAEGGALDTHVAAIESALGGLDLGAEGFAIESATPTADARFEALCSVIDRLLRADDDWLGHERLVVFTEYKTTLDHLEARLLARYGEDRASGAIRVLYGGLDPKDRTAVTESFNDPADAVRILVATDTASEGLNLQETARYLLHFDVPWNPSRIEQRNGRLDRHGQARDVLAHHFSSEEEQDVKFLSRVVEKVNAQREDLGSVGELFDAAFERRLIDGDSADSVLDQLDQRIAAAQDRADTGTRDRAADRRESEWARGEQEHQRLRVLGEELDLTPDALRETLSLALSPSRDALEGPDDRGSFRLRLESLGPDWQDLVDETLRTPAEGRTSRAPRGTLDRLLFDPSGFLQAVEGPEGKTGRRVFRPTPNTTLLHLGHPIFHRALARFARYRFPGNPDADRVSRWTIARPKSGRGPIPEDAHAVLLVTIEEFAVNDLRETFHHWVRTLAYPIEPDGEGWRLGTCLPHRAAPERQRDLVQDTSSEARSMAADIWLEVSDDVQNAIEEHRRQLQGQLDQALASDLETARDEAIELFRSRNAELSTLIQNQTIEKLEKDIEDARRQSSQGLLFDGAEQIAELERDIKSKEAEVKRRKDHWQSLREALDQERVRVLDRVLPRRHRLHGEARAFPVGVEIVLAGGPS